MFRYGIREPHYRTLKNNLDLWICGFTFAHPLFYPIPQPIALTRYSSVQRSGEGDIIFLLNERMSSFWRDDL